MGGADHSDHPPAFDLAHLDKHRPHPPGSGVHQHCIAGPDRDGLSLNCVVRRERNAGKCGSLLSVQLLGLLDEELSSVGLELHEGKTKIVTSDLDNSISFVEISSKFIEVLGPQRSHKYLSQY